MKNILLLLMIMLPSQVRAQQDADIILTNATVYALTPGSEGMNTVVIKNGKIIATGNRKLLEKYKGNTIDLKGKFVYPGFIDAHCHFSGYALDKYKCDLFGTVSFEEVIARLVAYEKTNAYSWVYGRGWDQNNWKVKEFPDKSKLDQLFRDKPVILKRVDGHAILCNQKALDMAGITTDTKVEGGQIIKDNTGKLTGILIDNAMNKVENLVGTIGQDEEFKYLKETENECFALGLTSVVDCGVTEKTIQLLKQMYSEQLLSIGNTVLLSQDSSTLETYVYQGPFKAGRLSVSGIKIYSDGALGSRGACLLEDYSDERGLKGTMLCDEQTVMKIGNQALKYGWQVCTHAIGDSANRIILKWYGELLGGKNDKRWRIEHAQVVNKADFRNFATYSIVPSVQPTHAVSDMHWAESRLGKQRIKSAYAYKDLLDQAGYLALGTDFPVEAINPLATFYAAVARKDNKGWPATGFQKENALSREEALKGMTLWAARSVFLENEKGSIESGKDADIIVLDKDIMKVPEDEIMSAKVLLNVCNGQIVYDQL